MSASASRPIGQPERFGRLWWLPDQGEGNGLDDTGWAPLAVGDIGVIRALVAELRVAGVPAFAAPVTRRPPRRRQRGRSDRYQLWADTSRYCRAEDILRVKLPALLATARRRPVAPLTAGTRAPWLRRR
jgi:hypothetical protein